MSIVKGAIAIARFTIGSSCWIEEECSVVQHAMCKGTFYDAVIQLDSEAMLNCKTCHLCMAPWQRIQHFLGLLNIRMKS